MQATEEPRKPNKVEAPPTHLFLKRLYDSGQELAQPVDEAKDEDGDSLGGAGFGIDGSRDKGVDKSGARPTERFAAPELATPDVATPQQDVKLDESQPAPNIEKNSDGAVTQLSIAAAAGVSKPEALGVVPAGQNVYVEATPIEMTNLLQQLCNDRNLRLKCSMAQVRDGEVEFSYEPQQEKDAVMMLFSQFRQAEPSSANAPLTATADPFASASINGIEKQVLAEQLQRQSEAEQPAGEKSFFSRQAARLADSATDSETDFDASEPDPQAQLPFRRGAESKRPQVSNLDDALPEIRMKEAEDFGASGNSLSKFGKNGKQLSEAAAPHKQSAR